MELPSYRLPKASNVLKEMWERGKAFLLRASTVILAASIVLWFLQSFDYKFSYGVSPDRSILAEMGRLLAPVFKPLGWGNWQTAVATLTGLAAKETVVTTLNILGVDGTMFTPLSAYSFMTFNLLAAPCISAIAASFRELHSAKTGWFAIAFQICFAYVVSLVIYQAGILYAKNNMVFWSVGRHACRRRIPLYGNKAADKASRLQHGVRPLPQKQKLQTVSRRRLSTTKRQKFCLTKDAPPTAQDSRRGTQNTPALRTRTDCPRACCGF